MSLNICQSKFNFDFFGDITGPSGSNKEKTKTIKFELRLKVKNCPLQDLSREIKPVVLGENECEIWPLSELVAFFHICGLSSYFGYLEWFLKSG